MENVKPQNKAQGKAELQVEEVHPEVKSYIHQILQEFDPFTTPDTSIIVIARDPLKLLSQVDEHLKAELPARKLLKKMFRIGIQLTEDGTTLEEEGLHEDIYEAIKIAKDKLIKQLNEIQDEMMSAQERTSQIQTAKASGQVH